MSINLPSRNVTLGVGINTRREIHGEDKVPAKDIRIRKALLTKVELIEIHGDAHIWDMLYVDRPGQPPSPYHRKRIPKMKLSGKYLGTTVTLWVGINREEIAISAATAKSLEIEPQEGGLTALSFTVSALTAAIKGDLRHLENFLDQEVEAAIVLGGFAEGDEESDEKAADKPDDKQASLNLDHNHVGTPEEERAKAKTREAQIHASKQNGKSAAAAA